MSVVEGSKPPAEGESGVEQTGNATRHVLEFGDETLLHIVKYLHGPDFNHEALVSLASTCHKFDNLLQDRSLCEVIKFIWSLRSSREALVGYLRQRSRSYLVTKFHITDMYWIPSGVLRDVIAQMPNLQVLQTNFHSLILIYEPLYAPC